MKRRQVLLASFSCVASVPSVAIPRPFLQVRGNISKFTDATRKVYDFSESEFLALPQTSVTTSTLWTPRAKFDGPKLQDVMTAVGAKGQSLHILALDEYAITVPWDDMPRYGLVLAHSRDGVRMGPDTFGPLWLVYPRDKFPQELGGAKAIAKFIWQAWRITVS